MVNLPCGAYLTCCNISLANWVLIFTEAVIHPVQPIVARESKESRMVMQNLVRRSRLEHVVVSEVAFPLHICMANICRG